MISTKLHCNPLRLLMAATLVLLPTAASARPSSTARPRTITVRSHTPQRHTHTIVRHGAH